MNEGRDGQWRHAGAARNLMPVSEFKIRTSGRIAPADITAEVEAAVARAGMRGPGTSRAGERSAA
jgi:hypothetical protein